MMNRYMAARDVRREYVAPSGQIRAGMLHPAIITEFQGSESGSLKQTVDIELEPIAGRLVSQVTAEITTVFCPLPALDALKNPEDDLPGNAEAFRKKLEEGSAPFGIEAEGPISQAARINPRYTGGQRMVSEKVKLGHNCAVNFMRRMKYVKATQLDASNADITPALLSSTALERLNGVLDPEDRVNGSLTFNVPNVKLPVKGMGTYNRHATTGSLQVREVDEAGATFIDGWVIEDPDDGSDPGQAKLVVAQDPDNPGFPGVFAQGDLATSQMSLTDFYTARDKDRLTRMMRKLVDNYPQYGEELVARFAMGLNVEVDNQPIILYQREKVFGRHIHRAMDGANLDQEQSDHSVQHTFTVPVPKTEFGGIVVTFVSIKPDEVLQSQPHPTLSKPHTGRNFVADELMLDPVPVTVRELYSDCDPVDAETTVMYIGNNHLEKNYQSYGWTRDIDENNVANKTALWQFEIPLSNTPENILYDTPLDIYPFALNDPEDPVATYTAESLLIANTPIIFGPTPVEELAHIEQDNVFGDAADYPAGEGTPLPGPGNP